MKLSTKPRHPFLNLTEINNVMDLQPFIHTLVELERCRARGDHEPISPFTNQSFEFFEYQAERGRRASCSFNKHLEATIDRMIEADFVEPIIN